MFHFQACFKRKIICFSSLIEFKSKQSWKWNTVQISVMYPNLQKTWVSGSQTLRHNLQISPSKICINKNVINRIGEESISIKRNQKPWENLFDDHSRKTESWIFLYTRFSCEIGCRSASETNLNKSRQIWVTLSLGCYVESASSQACTSGINSKKLHSECQRHFDVTSPASHFGCTQIITTLVWRRRLGREIIKQFVKNKVNVCNKKSKLFAREIKVFTAYHAVTRNRLIYGRSGRRTFAILPLEEWFAFHSGKVSRKTSTPKKIYWL